jgi:hypothetical protein
MLPELPVADGVPGLPGTPAVQPVVVALAGSLFVPSPVAL